MARNYLNDNYITEDERTMIVSPFSTSTSTNEFGGSIYYGGTYYINYSSFILNNCLTTLFRKQNKLQLE